MAMKIFLFGLLLCFASQGSCQRSNVEECKKELNYEGELRKIGASATKEDKCFIACIYKKTGELKEDGTIDLDKAKEAINSRKKSSPEQKEKRFQAAKECVSEVVPGSDKCESAYKHHMCRKSKGSCQRPNIEECKKELNYEGDLRKIGDSATRNDKCFIACILTKNGELKEDGTIDLDKTKEAIDSCKKSSPEQKEKRFQAAKDCVSEVAPGSDKCESAYKHHMCRMSKRKN